MNNAPGLVRMPPGVIVMKKDYDVSIPIVMVKQTDGEALNDILSRNPKDTTLRVVGEVVVKGVTTIAGQCATSRSWRRWESERVGNSAKGYRGRVDTARKGQRFST